MVWMANFHLAEQPFWMASLRSLRWKSIPALNQKFYGTKKNHTRILSANFESFVPHKTVDAKLWNPMELHEVALALSINKNISVDTKALHHAKRARNATVGHNPHNHVWGLMEHNISPHIYMRIYWPTLGLKTNKVPK
jgi:hypothetical protein